MTYGYKDSAGVTARANSALCQIEILLERREIPSAARLVLIAQIMAEEPVLTDPYAGHARAYAAVLSSQPQQPNPATR